MTSIAAEVRHEWLIDQLRQHKTVSLRDAAQQLEVAEMTIRRDFDVLESTGIARRVRGGAVYVGPVSFEGRDQTFRAEKDVIARKLLPLVPSSGVIAIDSSSTMNRLAKMMASQNELTVVTNGLANFQVLRERPGIKAVLTGGAADRRSDSLVGPVATDFLNRVRFTCFFSSAAAVDESAIYEDTFEEADVKRAFSRASTRVNVGVHAEKLGQQATALSMELGLVSILATELELTESLLDVYRENSVSLL